MQLNIKYQNVCCSFKTLKPGPVPANPRVRSPEVLSYLNWSPRWNGHYERTNIYCTYELHTSLFLYCSCRFFQQAQFGDWPHQRWCLGLYLRSTCQIIRNLATLPRCHCPLGCVVSTNRTRSFTLRFRFFIIHFFLSCNTGRYSRIHRT